MMRIMSRIAARLWSLCWIVCKQLIKSRLLLDASVYYSVGCLGFCPRSGYIVVNRVGYAREGQAPRGDDLFVILLWGLFAAKNIY